MQLKCQYQNILQTHHLSNLILRVMMFLWLTLSKAYSLISFFTIKIPRPPSLTLFASALIGLLSKANGSNFTPLSIIVKTNSFISILKYREKFEKNKFNNKKPLGYFQFSLLFIEKIFLFIILPLCLIGLIVSAISGTL